MNGANILDRTADTAVLEIQDVDFAVLEQLCKGHTEDEGW